VTNIEASPISAFVRKTVPIHIAGSTTGDASPVPAPAPDPALRELRDLLAASYPAIPVRALVRAARRRGLTSFPPGLLVAGSLSDRSAAGPSARLSAAARRRNDGSLHPLFSAEYYATANADVGASGVSPWLHYQVFGRVEGRSPHPLVDVTHLSASLPGIRVPDAVDEYLARRELWVIDPGPYVDCLRFTLFGGWDPAQHPLQQIVSTQLRSHWVHQRLMLVDASSNDGAAARLAGVGYLLARNTNAGRFARVTTWSRDASPAPDRGDYTVVPGFFLGVQGSELWADQHGVASQDSTVVRALAETISVENGQRITADQLVYVTAHLDREQLDSLVGSMESGVIAPHNRAQEISLRQLRRDSGRPEVSILAVGVQAHVSGARLRLVDGGETRPAVPAWSWDLPADNVAIVMPTSTRLRATGDQPLRAALAAGAELCLVDERGLNSWLPQLQSRETVVVDPSLVDDVASFVARDSIRLLPPTGRAR